MAAPYVLSMLLMTAGAVQHLHIDGMRLVVPAGALVAAIVVACMPGLGAGGPSPTHLGVHM
jgi:hypothetical protein